jgi:nucleoside-diphosphate-sugar epimerase
LRRLQLSYARSSTCILTQAKRVLEHLNVDRKLPARIVVLGAAGFVGTALVKLLAQRGASYLALSRQEIDLTSSGASEDLAKLLRPDDALVAIAAKAPVKTNAMLIENMAIVRSMTDALARSPVSHAVNISSDAVYADAPVPITEQSTPAAPTTLHGVMHLARELAFKSVAAWPLAILRPSLLYGATDPHNGYGPNRFRRLANAGEDIVLFGEGEELRDHVFVDDVAELIVRVLERRSAGILNIATGSVHSFADTAKMVAAAANRTVAIRSTARSGPIPHNGYRPFDIAACRAAFPDFRYTSLAEGIAQSQQNAGNA